MRNLLLLLTFLSSATLTFAARVTPSEEVESFVTIRDAASNGLEIGRLLPGESAELIETEDSSYLIRQDNGSYGYVSLYWTDVIETDQNNYLSLHFIDTGEGDSTLVVCPDNSTILVDAGASTDLKRTQMINYINEVLGPNNTIINTLFLSHKGFQNLSSLPALLENFSIGKTILVGEDLDSTNSSISLLPSNNVSTLNTNYFNYSDTPLSQLNCGDAELFVLAANTNTDSTLEDSQSIILKIQYDEFSAILSSKSSNEIENLVLSRYSSTFLKADVLKTANQGDASTANSTNWLNTVKPYIAVISTQAQNVSGYPSKELIDRLSPFTISEEKFEHSLTSAKIILDSIIWGTNTNYQELIYSTADSGNIIIVSSGKDANVFTRAHAK